MTFIDRNADNKLRLRRNAQRTRKGDGVAVISATPPLVNTGGTISLNLASAGGLAVASSQLTIKLPSPVSALGLSASGLFVVLPTVSGLNVSSNGLAISLPANSGLTLSVSGLAISLPASSGLVLVSTGLKTLLNNTSGLVLTSTGLAAAPDTTTIAINGSNLLSLVSTAYTFQSADHTLVVSPTGFFIDFSVTTRNGSGLTKSLGVIINTDVVSTAVNASNQLVVRGFEQLTSDPGSPNPGQGWFNSTLGLLKINPSIVLASLPSTIPVIFFTGGGSSVINNTSALTLFTPDVTIPAGYFNFSGRAIKATCILGGSGVSGNFTFSLQYGGTTIWTAPVVSTAAMGNLWIELLISTVATGTSGSLLVLGKVFNSSTAYTAANALTTVNLTTSHTLDMAGQFTVANVSNSAQMSFWSFELLG